MDSEFALESRIREIVVLVGIPGSGKTTIARKSFEKHTRVSLDALGTRSKELMEIRRALIAEESLVIDNTNSTRKARRRYVDLAIEFGVPVRAVYVKCPLSEALERNRSRFGKEFVPEKALKMYYGILEEPQEDEGFESVKVIETDTS